MWRVAAALSQRGFASGARRHGECVRKAFYFDRISPATVALAEWAKKNGAVVLFEPSSIGEDGLFERAVDACHILKFSHERFRKDTELAQAREPNLVVRTLGKGGLEARWKGRWSRFAPFVAPRVVDTAGAGDWCSVALLHVLAQKGAKGLTAAQKGDIERALRLGQALAALSCGFEGARGLMTALSWVERLSKMLRTMVGGRVSWMTWLSRPSLSRRLRFAIFVREQASALTKPANAKRA